MNVYVPTAHDEEGAEIALASFGSGGGSRAASARSAGRGGRKAAPPRAIQSLRAAARRAGATPGRGRRGRSAIAREIEQATSGRRRLTNRQIQDFRRRLAGG